MMRHERKRDWPQLVYEYGIRGLRVWDALPGPIHQEADAMRALWNSLVALHHAHHEEYQRIMSSDIVISEYEQQLAAVEVSVEAAMKALKHQRSLLRTRKDLALEPYQLDLDTARQKLRSLRADGKALKLAARERLRERLKAISEVFFAKIKAVARDCPAYWCNREAVVNSFLTARGKALKEGAELHWKGIRVREAHFQHRFTGGGLPAIDLFRPNTRVYLGNIIEVKEKNQRRWERRTCHFNVNGCTLAADVILHRPLPPGAIVKNVALVGIERDAPVPDYLNWKWKLCISLEVPHKDYGLPISRNSHAPVAAIDFNWRVWGEGKTLRVATIKDSFGLVEHIILPESIMERWNYARELQEALGLLLEETKKTLFALPREGLRENALSLFTHWDKRRANALTKLFYLTGGYDDYQQILKEWRYKSGRLRREISGVMRHYLGCRRHFYRELAARLCSTYRVLAMEDLSLKKMAEKDKSPALENADRYRFLAGLSFLRSDIAHSAARRDTEIKLFDPAYSTTTCAKCQGKIEQTGSVMLYCENGHRVDQDENACEVGLQRTVSQISGLLGQI